MSRLIEVSLNSERVGEEIGLTNNGNVREDGNNTSPGDCAQRSTPGVYRPWRFGHEPIQETEDKESNDLRYYARGNGQAL
jgi:hypothetical protein